MVVQVDGCSFFKWTSLLIDFNYGQFFKIDLYVILTSFVRLAYILDLVHILEQILLKVYVGVFSDCQALVISVIFRVDLGDFGALSDELR